MITDDEKIFAKLLTLTFPPANDFSKLNKKLVEGVAGQNFFKRGGAGENVNSFFKKMLAMISLPGFLIKNKQPVCMRVILCYIIVTRVYN